MDALIVASSSYVFSRRVLARGRAVCIINIPGHFRFFPSLSPSLSLLAASCMHNGIPATISAPARSIYALKPINVTSMRRSGIATMEDEIHPSTICDPRQIKGH